MEDGLNPDILRAIDEIEIENLRSTLRKVVFFEYINQDKARPSFREDYIRFLSELVDSYEVNES